MAKEDKSDIAEKVLKRKKDPALQKQLQLEQITAVAGTEEKIGGALQKSRREKQAAEKRKKQFRYGGGAVGALVFIYLVYYLFKPFEGGMDYGLCKVFLERNVQYPHTLHVSSIESFADYMRIWYAQVDAFGEYRMSNIRCTFEADPNYGLRLKKVSFDRRDVDPAKVAAFNKTIPTIFANPPDLTYPTPLPDSLEDLQLDTGLFRKPIL